MTRIGQPSLSLPPSLPPSLPLIFTFTCITTCSPYVLITSPVFFFTSSQPFSSPLTQRVLLAISLLIILCNSLSPSSHYKTSIFLVDPPPPLPSSSPHASLPSSSCRSYPVSGGSRGGGGGRGHGASGERVRKFNPGDFEDNSDDDDDEKRNTYNGNSTEQQ